MRQRFRWIVMLMLLLAGGAGFAQAEDALTLQGPVLDAPANARAPLIRLERGASARTPPATLLDLHYRSEGALDLGPLVRTGITVYGLVDPQQDALGEKWVGQEIMLEVQDANPAALHHLVGLITRALHVGTGPLQTLYGQHIIAATQRNGGSVVDTIYGTYTSVGLLGSASGTGGRAVGHQVSDCFNTYGTIGEGREQ